MDRFIGHIMLRFNTPVPNLKSNMDRFIDERKLKMRANIVFKIQYG